MHEIVANLSDKMGKSFDSFVRDLTKIRTGRASISLLDGVKVEAYGSSMPLNQVASLTVPESRMIAIQPWDPQLIGEIEKAIHRADLGLTPMNDGKIVRISVPQLTEERRRDLVKQVRKLAEEARVAVRNLRRDANEHLKKMKKDKEISEDEQFRLQDEAQKLTDESIRKIDHTMAEKEKEVMEV
ncbi:MAG: ribosome recycling factor [Thermodesulfobacteriota bacterium]